MSDRDKSLRAADDEIPLATSAIYLEHLSRNLQKLVVSLYGIYSILLSVLLLQKRRSYLSRQSTICRVLTSLSGLHRFSLARGTAITAPMWLRL